jgi:malate dehydrogenase (oxaloacetate-decarboxylating)(NADP+)
MSSNIYQQSLEYHKAKPEGKLSVISSKPVLTQHDLSLAYSPGVAEPCRVIHKDALAAFDLTSKGNLVAVISNGTSVLGLGDIGALASKPVMEGKAILFKKFANIDSFDIEINETDPDKLVDIIASLEPTFGGINLEDIKAPECFYIEKKLSERLKIPVFHDDQHGTAIIVCSAVFNALELVNKKIDEVKLVTSGAGAASIACLDLLVDLGVKKSNIIVCDSKGVLNKQRTDKLDQTKLTYVTDSKVSDLKEAICGADIFLGLSKANILDEEMLVSMATNPIILALSNPEPEVSPDLVKKVRPDAIIATGRSDFPNQVNNALCFPYIFRGALDVRATKINKEMKIACVHAIAKLAKAECCDTVSSVYNQEELCFGKDYIIPKPFDRRLFVEIAFAVAKAAIESGVAQKNITDLKHYKQSLKNVINQSGLIMRPIFSMAQNSTDKSEVKIVFAEGEEERVLQAVQSLIDEDMGSPILIGRPDIIQKKIKKMSLRLVIDQNITVLDPNNYHNYQKYFHEYHSIMARKGISASLAKTLLRTNGTIIASMMVYLNDAQAMICGSIGRYVEHLKHVKYIVGMKQNHSRCSTICGLFPSGALHLENRSLFIADPYVNVDPTSEQIAEIVFAACDKIRNFGIVPKVALLSHSNFGSSRQESAKKMRRAFNIISNIDPDLEIDGEMHADAALMPHIRGLAVPNSKLKTVANLLVMPNIDAANIAFNLVKSLNSDNHLGPILLGVNGAVQIVTASSKSRSIFNMAALAVADARFNKDKL